MATTGDEKFQLIIRCAMQSFSDYTVECPAEWSILQLKEHLSQVCHMKPEVSRQRLIYAGHCLVNDQKVRDVLAQRRDGIQRNEPADKQVIHMVYIGQTLPAPRNTSGEGLRHRGTTNSTNNTHQMRPDLSSSQNQQQFPQMFLPQQQQYNFANFQTTPINQQQQQSYEAWMTAYQNYMNQMQQFYQQLPYGPGPIHHPAQAFGFVGTAQMPMMQQPGHRVIINGHQLVIPAQQHRPPNQENAVEGRMAMGGAGLQQAMPDLLDIVYKSIRFALLAMVLYLYSSLERFIFVLAIVALFWFVHRRRDQQREQNEQQPQGQQEEEGAEPAQNQQPDEPVPDAVNGPQPVNNNNTPAGAPSAWNVFFTVVQSFFTSLVPNPAPVPLDIN